MSKKIQVHRGRKPGSLTDADKAHMAEARTTARQNKVDALAAVSSNNQFTNPKFWTKVDPATSNAVVVAIQKASEKAKAIQIAALEAKLEALKG
jgi:response regulator of citrate/malate metabolism